MTATIAARRAAVAIDDLRAAAYTVPTDVPESDGTLAWEATTIVVVELTAGGSRGLGYSYGHPGALAVVESPLRERVLNRDALDVAGAWRAMADAVRNAGRPGIASHAIAAVDVALWDLKARLLDVSVAQLLGRVRDAVPIYGSGGFTSYSRDQLRRQLSDWVDRGIRRVKIKVGRDPERDAERLTVARDAVGADTELFVDANGAFARKQALAWAGRYADHGVTWFEEPVSSDDLEGLRLLRDRGPGGMAIAAGEYGYDLVYFRRMLQAGAVDVLQVDVTRCGGITELLRVAALCEAHGVPLSAHTAPSIHAHAGAALAPLVHVEYFHDHARVEHMLFDGVLEPDGGMLRPDAGRPGLGLELRRDDARRFLVAGAL